MALRGNLEVISTAINFSMNEVAVPGQVVAHANQTDSSSHFVARLATSGLYFQGGVTGSNPIRVIGILMDEVVAALTNSTTYVYAVGGAGNSTMVTDTASNAIFLNPQGQRYVGEKVGIIRKGFVTTDQIFPGIYPSGGTLAYAASGGLIGDGSSVGAGQSGVVIGQFNGPKDSDGYAEVYIDVDAPGARYNQWGVIQ